MRGAWKAEALQELQEYEEESRDRYGTEDVYIDFIFACQYDSYRNWQEFAPDKALSEEDFLKEFDDEVGND